MRPWAVALFIGLSLAGCFGGDGDGDGTPTPSATPEPSTTPAATTTRPPTTSPAPSPSPSPAPTEPENNRAPRAVLLASSGGGQAPVVVNFTFDAHDVNGDDLAWSFDADGDGMDDLQGTQADLPASTNFTYNATGLFNATFTVTDGFRNAAEALPITVSAAPAQPFFTFQATTDQPCQVFCSNDPVLGVFATGANGCAGFTAGEQGIDCVWTDLPTGSAGRAFTSTSTGGDPDLEFRSECSSNPTTAMGRSAVGGPESGMVPEGAACVVIWEWAATASTHTFQVA